MAKEKILKGIAVSEGIAQGTVFIYETNSIQVFQTPILSVYLEDETARFEKAVERTKKELMDIKELINKEIGGDFAQFLDAQIMMLEDRTIIETVKKRIIEEKKNAEYIYHQVINDYASKLGESKDQYLSERVADIWDVGMRVLRNLLGLTHSSVVDVPPGTIIAAHDIPPSEAALIDPNNVLGIVTEGGGRTSHTAITARALEIPAVLGVEGLMGKIKNSETVLIDGDRGILIKNPSRGRIHFYEVAKKKERELEEALSPYCELPPKTHDGKYIDISANIEFFAEFAHAKKYGAVGIGLFRTEFLYLTRRGNPSEEEQFRVYNALAQRMKPHPVIIRTFDLGGDKIVSHYHEANPFLGWRAIRVCLDNWDFLKIQLRAILRASANRNVKIMYPMISTYEEIKRVNLIFDKVKKELKSKKIEFDEDIQVGIMIETPSAALLSSHLTSQVDFFSIGSNELTQYTLAVDRGNERVSKLFDHFHPAVLNLIKRVIDAGHDAHIWVGLCGELAADPLAIPLLLGFGIDELSMNPASIPRAKLVLRSITIPECEKIAHDALGYRTALEVKRFLRRAIRKTFPGVEQVIK
ncbi:MAG: phosphoenolpyruvate--protein phosphotransferase [candidate division WOR-3 bacterium]|nr:MAG: phosphoenolpyruvate--protein phosphotransferase [candidate division WOR-3 bacterium]